MLNGEGTAALAAETPNGPKCQELGWTCVPLAVNWGKEAQGIFTRLASHLAISLSLPKTSILDDIYGG